MPRPAIAITRSDLAGLTWIVLRGELDLAGAGLVGGDLTCICDAHAHVVIDARDVTFIDLAGLRILAGLERRQRDRGGKHRALPAIFSPAPRPHGAQARP